MSEEQKEEYRNLGIIEDGFSFPMPGEFSEQLWLIREPAWEEKLRVKGKIYIYHPLTYESAVFDSGKKGVSQVVDGQEFTLLDIDKNILTFRVKGDRRKAEQVKKLYLNKDSKPFASMNSVAIDTEMYHKIKDTKEVPSDEELQKIVANFNMADTHIDQVNKVKVTGNIAKAAFYKVLESRQREVDFEIEYTVQF